MAGTRERESRDPLRLHPQDLSWGLQPSDRELRSSSAGSESDGGQSLLSVSRVTQHGTGEGRETVLRLVWMSVLGTCLCTLPAQGVPLLLCFCSHGLAWTLAVHPGGGQQGTLQTLR